VGAAKEGAENAKVAVKGAAKADAKAKAEIAAEVDGEGKGKDGKSKGAGAGDGEGAGDQQGAGGGGGVGENTQDETDAYGNGGDGIGGGHGKAEIDDSDNALKDIIRDMIDEAEVGLDDIADDEDLQADAAAAYDAVKAVVNNGKMNAKGVAAKATGTPARAEHLAAVRKVVTVLTKIRQDMEPQINRAQPQGRVDVRRFITRNPMDYDVFTAYDEGSEDLTGIEAVLLMDMSGSMGGQMGEASAALWVLKRAFDKLGIRTTAMVYDTDHEVLYQPSERAKPASIAVVRSRGGTDPQSALEQAQVIFSKSHQPNKVLITVTDGQWGGDERRRAGLMKAMHRDGVTSMCLTIGMGHHRPRGTHHGIVHDLKNVGDLPKAALKLVVAIMRRAGV
jgi:hypothetical protein